MLDDRRLTTEEVLEEGILQKEVPKSIYPDNIEWEEFSFDFDGIPSEEECREALLANKGLEGNGYYGLPSVWSEGNGKYALDCLQYRERTVERHGLTLDEAVNLFIDLAEECRG